MSKSSKNHRTQIHKLTTNAMSANNVKRVVLPFRSRDFLLFSFIPKGYCLAAFYGDKNKIRVSQVDIISFLALWGVLKNKKQIKENKMGALKRYCIIPGMVVVIWNWCKTLSFNSNPESRRAEFYINIVTLASFSSNSRILRMCCSVVAFWPPRSMPTVVMYSKYARFFYNCNGKNNKYHTQLKRNRSFHFF